MQPTTLELNWWVSSAWEDSTYPTRAKLQAAIQESLTSKP
jgi:hypothetical protein